jgi:DnaJ-class molecular chaperone
LAKTKKCPDCDGRGEKYIVGFGLVSRFVDEATKCEKCNGSGKVLYKNSILEFWKRMRNFGRSE